MRASGWVLGTIGIFAGVLVAPAATAQDGPRDLFSELEALRRGYDIPSLAAAAYRDGELRGAGAAGSYSMEPAIPVTTQSRYHMGSCTKAMTAVIVASLIEDGKLDWDTTLPEALPELVPFINEAYRGVTIRDLLAHRAGVAESMDSMIATLPWTQLAEIADAEPRVQRTELAKTVLSAAPSAPPGEGFVYSNFGYIIAALAAETAAEESWEDLIRTRVFEPLGIASAGFGPPGTPTTPVADAVDEPLGHTKLDEWRPMMLYQGQALPDNPVVFNPAGRVHASILDWGRFVDDFERGLDGEGTLLDAESYATLAEDPEADGYALGWGVSERPWADGQVLLHAGSNRMWYAVAWIAPEKDLSIVVATNAATPEAKQACDDAVMLMVNSFTFTPARDTGAASSDATDRP